jgi:hypothetical protein
MTHARRRDANTLSFAQVRVLLPVTAAHRVIVVWA